MTVSKPVRMNGKKYDERFDFMIGDREEKVRERGLTMVIGDGPFNVGGMNGLNDLVDVAGEWIDWYKIVWSSWPFQPPSLMTDKIELLDENDVIAFTGGNFLEAAVEDGTETQYFEALIEGGCPGVEVSSTTIDMTLDEKIGLIERATEYGLHVHAEIGKKASETDGDSLRTDTVIAEMSACLDAGADIVIFEMEEIEAAIAGDGADVDAGSIEKIHTVLDAVGKENILFEVPLGSFAEVMEVSGWFIDAIGSDVNLGNVNPNHVLLVEQQRRGIGPHSL